MAAKIAVAEEADQRPSAIRARTDTDWGFGGSEQDDGAGPDAVDRVKGGENDADPLGWRVTIGRTDLPPVGANANGNRIKTSIYTWWDFIPKNLYFQFHRFANWFFLTMSLINFVPEVRTFAPMLSFLPLVLVLVAQAVIDFVEDRRRHISDYEINNKEAATVSPDNGAPSVTRWSDVMVGDIIRLSSGDAIPADLLLLYTSDPSGVAFVDTSNLDGETNLKPRSIFYERETEGAPPPFDPKQFVNPVQCDQPNVKIYSFNGFVEHDHHRVVLSAENLLLRDCVLRNTDEVYGVVVYAGHETKAMLNNTGPRHKVTKLENRMNRAVIYSVSLLFVMSLIGAIASYVDQTQFDLTRVVFEIWGFQSKKYNASLDSFERFWSWVVILQALVPLALYVSVVYVKFFQVYFVNADVELYDALTNTPMNCRALNLTEDLGQIQHVFSDKTGTLTQNVMMFRCCSLGGIVYRHGFEGLSEFDPNDRAITLDTELSKALQSGAQSDILTWDAVNTDSTEHMAMMCLALCNTARPAVVDDLADTARNLAARHTFLPGELHFEAESPDEVALLDAALAYGYAFCYTDIYNKHVRIGETARTFRILATLEFDPTRKCMSVVVERSDGTVRLYCKGADSSIISRLGPRDAVAKDTEKHVDEFAALGLRTLCLAYRDMHRAEFDKWLVGWDKARSSMSDRDAKTEAAVAELETDLTMIGTTGVEDALQAGVPNTIAALRRGGMNVWVVTGDKQETAIQIANTCKLFSKSDRMLLLNSPLAKRSEKVPIDQASAYEARCHTEAADLISKLSTTIANDPETSWVLVVDGPTLSYCLAEENLPKFVDVSTACHAAVICRATPFQKAQVISAVKQERDVMTLAIGDGANDCSMIQMAHIGVGISGREGRQAVMASDFAIAQFRFLQRLLFVHGTWNYERVALLLQYFFFKNVMFNVVAFLYGFVSWWSGTIFFNQLLFLLYNFFFTSLPQIYAAVYDRPATAKTLMAVPELYSRGRLDQGYTDRHFFAAVLESFVCGTVVFAIPFAVIDNTEASMLMLGQACLTLLIFVANMYTLLNSWNIDRFQLLCQFLSILAYLVFNTANYSVWWVEFLEETLGLTPSPYGIFTHSWGRPWFWAAVTLAFAIITLGRLFLMTAVRWFRPTDLQFAREKESQGHTARRHDSCVSGPELFGAKTATSHTHF